MLGQELEGSNKSMEKRDHKAGEEEERGGARFGDGFSWGSDFGGDVVLGSTGVTRCWVWDDGKALRLEGISESDDRGRREKVKGDLLKGYKDHPKLYRFNIGS
ncbi:hypothetical protein FNV43_RR00813 [Rhamnella rubrinervis]|uniref:Uncharacterized protein n=1 Tax=Rhamnella rubrinervis TaxID=2594499 RepID=A0A8K0HRC4_9ROSA|nr:hypothetical protein FNV43_RR00813 [Rhamnella rubrinervis]